MCGQGCGMLWLRTSYQSFHFFLQWFDHQTAFCCQDVDVVARGSNSHFFSFRFTSNSHQLQLQLRLNSIHNLFKITIMSNSNSFQTQVTIISNAIQISNHIHFKFNSYSVERQKTPNSKSTSFQVYCAPKVRTCWLANALYFLKARLGSCFILALFRFGISRMFRFGISCMSLALFHLQAMRFQFWCGNVSEFWCFYFQPYVPQNITGTDMH